MLLVDDTAAGGMGADDEQAASSIADVPKASVKKRAVMSVPSE
jgi:hypothetical protein